jgi:acyl-CoA thioesterase
MTPQAIFDKMMKPDAFSHWMGLTLDTIDEGYCRLHYVITPEMLNGFGTVHGGILFSAADSAFAFACNSHGRLSVALEVSISFTQAARLGERLSVEAKEIYLGNKTSVYDIITRNADNNVIAIFKGTAYRTSRAV